jgi:hypothetical protein
VSDDLTIQISIDRDELTGTIDALDAMIGQPDAVIAAGRAVKDFLVQYHEAFADQWRGDHYMSGPHSGEWQQTVPAGWQDPVVINSGEETSVSVVNDAPYLAHKVLGGTIAPTNAQFLTIPLVPEAKGVRAAEFGQTLFHPKGTRVLAMKGSGKELIPIYALVESVNQAPWPGALPETDAIADVFYNSFQIQISEALDVGMPA